MDDAQSEPVNETPPEVQSVTETPAPDTVVGRDSQAAKISADKFALHSCLARVCELLGYTRTEGDPERVPDVATAGVSAELLPIVNFARGARLP